MITRIRLREAVHLPNGKTEAHLVASDSLKIEADNIGVWIKSDSFVLRDETGAPTHSVRVRIPWADISNAWDASPLPPPETGTVVA